MTAAEARYRPGDTLFREGDPSDVVLRVLAGEVEILKELDGQTVVLGRAGAGEFVGEMGALQGLPRSATVRAVGEVAVEVIPPEEFLRRISADADMALQLLVRLSERLRAADQRLAVALLAAAGRGTSEPRPMPSEPSATAPDGAQLTIFAETAELAGQLPPDGLAVTALPFRVGRRPEREDGTPTPKVDLLLDDAKPFRLSRAHFALERRGNGVVVRDLGSVLGTAVNGRFLGQHFATDDVPLEPGENRIIAGGAGSPFTFRVVLDHT